MLTEGTSWRWKALALPGKAKQDGQCGSHKDEVHTETVDVSSQRALESSDWPKPHPVFRETVVRDYGPQSWDRAHKPCTANRCLSA